MIDHLIENIEIKHVVILDTDKAGDAYIERVFPYWVDVVVITLEGKYPLNPNLRKRVLDRLETDEDIFCFCFGLRAEKFPTKSHQRMKLAPILFLDLQYNTSVPTNPAFNEEKITNLMMAFSGATQYRLRKEDMEKYDFDTSVDISKQWYHYLCV